VSYALAADRLLGFFVQEYNRSKRGPRLTAFKVVGPRGWHENYSASGTCESPQLIGLLPHLITRIIFGGGGGFRLTGDPTFVLSPRADLVTRISHSYATPLLDSKYSTKDDHRHHFLCGDPNFCATSIFLQAATTALVIRMCESGEAFMGLQPDFPLDAIRAFSLDPELKTRRRVADGRSMTAIEIQRELLLAVKNSDAASVEWAEFTFRLWEGVLNDLEAGHRAALKDDIDWIAKYEYLNIAEEEQLLTAPEKKVVDQEWGRLGNGLTGQIPGLSGGISRRGGRATSVARAMIEPPPQTRASVRGRAIKQLWLEGLKTAEITWTSITAEDRRLSFEDMDCTDANWHSIA
jgi:proteasome accessory factor A